MKRERLAGALFIDDILREALARYRANHGITASAHLPLAGVKAVEDGLGIELPDAVWAFVAAGGREPLQVLTHTEDAREHMSFPRRYIAFDRDTARRSYFCLDRRTLQRALPPVHEWSGVNPGGGYWKSLTDFVQWRSELTPDPFDLDAARAGGTGPMIPFAAGEPALVGSSEATNVRRVRHQQFGEGVVVRQIAGPIPKLEIDFGPLGLKKILATYVTDLPLGDVPLGDLPPVALSPGDLPPADLPPVEPDA